MSQSLLQNVYLFKSFSAKELEGLKEICTTKTYGAGDSIFLRGESATALYLIKSGSVKVQRSTPGGDDIDVGRLGTGSHFGEMAFVDGETRSASVAASEATDLIVIPYDRLKKFLEAQPAVALKFYQELTQFLTRRLRATTNDLSFAREKNLSHF